MSAFEITTIIRLLLHSVNWNTA